MNLAQRIRVFWRLHFVQLFWNFKGMQNVGCLYAIRPVLRELHEGKAYLEAEKRHIQFFNTHPFFAPICLGVVAKIEEEFREGKFKKPEMIPVLKNRMSGPLAAVGDAYFWETIRPVLAALVVLSVYVFGPASGVTAVIFAAVLFVFIKQVETIRWRGLGWGYEHGLAVVELLKKKDFQGQMRKIRNASGFLLGIATVIFMLQSGPAGPVPAEIFLRGLVLICLVAATVKKVSPTTLLYLLVAAGVACGSVF